MSFQYDVLASWQLSSFTPRHVLFPVNTGNVFNAMPARQHCTNNVTAPAAILWPAIDAYNRTRYSLPRLSYKRNVQLHGHAAENGSSYFAVSRFQGIGLCIGLCNVTAKLTVTAEKACVSLCCVVTRQLPYTATCIFCAAGCDREKSVDAIITAVRDCIGHCKLIDLNSCTTLRVA